MLFKEMFKKSITRDIQGVVIAGQGEKTTGVTEALCRFLLCLCKRDPWKHDKNGCLDFRLLWKR